MDISRRAALKALAAGAVGLGTGVVGHGYAYQRYDLQLVRVSLRVAGLAPGLDGVRVGLITDLHHSEFVSQDQVRRAATMIMAERPDLIVLGGDYVTLGDRRYIEPCAEALSGLSAASGVFAILGNHDDDRFVPPALEARGFAVLVDQRTRVVLRGEPLDLVGIGFWTRSQFAIARLLSGSGPNVLLLAHDPRRLAEGAALGVPAILSGHTHGGQVVLPGLGAVAARRFPVVAGVATRYRTQIFVSRGVGTVVLPVRINCPPEVALVTLTRSAGVTVYPAGP
jgi:uncharacterized protein